MATTTATTIHSTRSNGEYLTPSAPRPLPPTIFNIQILHPGYDDVIIRLPILDIVDGSNPTQFGFHHGTALMICFIITGNRPGFFSSSRIVSEDPNAVANPPESGVPAFDDILLENSYYYYISSARLDEKYNILDDITGWSFPPRSSRQQFHWRQWEEVFDENETPGTRAGDHMTSNVSVLVKARDGSCRLTGAPAVCGCQSAQIIHASKKNWFIKNRMETFAKGDERETNPTSRPSNMFLLRADLHSMFDQHFFTFVPKQGQLVAHFVSTTPLTACRAFHSASIGRPTDLSAAYFLARLAITVIPLTVTFRERHGKFPTKSTKKRARESGGGSHGKKPKPGHDDMNDSATGSPTISTPRNTTPSSNDDERELEEDLMTAASHLPHIFGSSLNKSNLDSASPNPDYGGLVDTLSWYPGHRRVERMKEAYMKANPQVRATSGGSTGEGDPDSV